jgi:RNA exonuclease 1
MHSAFNTFFQAPVSGEERRRLQERTAGPYLLFSFLLWDRHLTAECAGNKDPTQYLLAVEQMIENDYRVPFYLADVFKKPDG